MATWNLLNADDPALARAAIGAAPSINPADWGATGDGLTDDTVAVQAAIGAAAAESLAFDNSNRRFVTVAFPPGQYMIANITVPTCVTLEGNGATLTAIAGTVGYLITFTDGWNGGLRNLHVAGANLTDALGGVKTDSVRRRILIEDCSIENFWGTAVHLEGGQPRIRNNYIAGMHGDQTALATHKGVLHLASTANDATVEGNEINGGRWHPTLSEYDITPAGTDMYVCGAAIIGAGFGMYSHNIVEQSETGWYFSGSIQVHMSGNRGELNWGHGYVFASGSGRIEGCLALDNSKYATGDWDGFHFGAGDTAHQGNFQVTNCVSKSNFGASGDFAQHRWAFYDIGFNPTNYNTYDNCRSEGDVGQFPASSVTPSYYGGGATHVIPNANSAYSMTGATPSVYGKTFFRCSGSTAITDFTGAARGQLFYVLGNGAVAVTHGANITMLSGATTTLTNNKWYVFLRHDGVTKQLDLASANLTNLATLDFPSVSAQSYQDLTITVTGAVSGDAVALGVTTGAIAAGVAYTAWVSAADTVTVRAHNYTGGAVNPGSGNFRASIIR